MSSSNEDNHSNTYLNIRYCISNRIYSEFPYYNNFNLRWMPLMPYFHIKDMIDPFNTEGKKVKYIDLQMSISNIFSGDMMDQFEDFKTNWYNTYINFLSNKSSNLTSVPFKRINYIANLMKENPGQHVELFNGITLKNVLKATSFGTYVFDAHVKFTDIYKEDIIVKVTTLYDFDDHSKPNYKIFSQSLISDGPPKSKAIMIKKMFEIYNTMACNNEKTSCSLFPHQSHNEIKSNHIIYMNEAWQEIITWINLFPESFYGHINLIDPDTGALYCVLFMKKYHSTFYDLIFNYFNQYAISHVPKNINDKTLKTFNEHIPNLIHTIVVQIVYILIPHFKTYFNYCHNDLKSDNIVYSKTSIDYIYLYLKFENDKNKLYKIPTYGRKVEFIDGAFSSVTLATNRKYDNINDNITNIDCNKNSSPLFINDILYEKTKENITFCSKNIFENLGKSTMNFFNTFTDVAQLSYSILRALSEWNIYPSNKPLSPKWQECINLLLDLSSLDERIDKSYQPILNESIILKNHGKLRGLSILSSYTEPEWSTEMYTVVSECCTYGCPKRQVKMISHLSKYEVKDIAEIKSVLSKYTVKRVINGKDVYKLKTVYPKFVIMRASNFKPPETYKSDSIELNRRNENVEEQKKLISEIINAAIQNDKVYTIDRKNEKNVLSEKDKTMNILSSLKNSSIKNKKYHHLNNDNNIYKNDSFSYKTSRYNTFDYYEPHLSSTGLYDYNIYNDLENDNDQYISKNNSLLSNLENDYKNPILTNNDYNDKSEVGKIKNYYTGTNDYYNIDGCDDKAEKNDQQYYYCTKV